MILTSFISILRQNMKEKNITK